MAAIRYRCNFRSLNGTAYRLDIWDKNHTGSASDFNITNESLEISYDTASEEKLTELICSNMSFEFLVEDAAQETFIEYLRADTTSEKDVYCFLWNATTGTYVIEWTGYLLLDLGEKVDEGEPYGVMLNCVDGLALLKDIDFVPDHDTNTPPYAYNDTYIKPSNTPSNSRYANFLEWIIEILDKADLGGGTNTGNSGVPQHRISTSVNWYNEKHGGLSGTLTNHDPLKNTACNGEQFYKQQGASNSGVLYYKPISAYDALVNICRSWGMRCIMYENVVYFIQISEYQKSESGTVSAPINIRTCVYTSSGTLVSTNEFIGNNKAARYVQEIEDNTSTGGLKKIAGTTWGEYPVIKKVSTNFPSISNHNSFTTFPTQYGQTDSPHTWPTFGTPTTGAGTWAQNTTPLGVYNDAYLLDGFYMMCSLSFLNTHVNNVEYQLGWTVRAKPVSGNWDENDALVATMSENGSGTGNWQLYWEPLMPVADLNTANGGNPDYDGRWLYSDTWTSTLGGQVDDQCFHKQITIPYGNTIVDIIQGTAVGNNGNLLPPHPDMTGDWEFEFVNMSRGGSYNYGAWFIDFHGAIIKQPPTPPFDGAVPWANYQTMIDPYTSPAVPYYNGFGTPINVWYNNVSNATGLNMFSPVTNGAVGSTTYNTQYFTNTADSYILDISDTLWGDTDIQDVPGSLKVYNGSSWVYTDYLGKWGRGVSTGGNSFTEQLCADALNMQSVYTEKGNYTIARSTINPDLSGNQLYPKYVNPIGKIYDQLNENYYFPIKQVINIARDEVSGMWSQMVWNSIAGSSTTTTHPNDDGGGPVDDDVSIDISNLPAAQQTNTTAARMINPVLAIKDFKARQTAFTSLKVNNQGLTNGQTLKSGDVVLLETQGKTTQLTLTADFITEGGETSETISFSSVTLNFNVNTSSKIYVDQQDWYNQSMRKTRGQIAGFDVSATGLTKGGITIDGFIDSDIMEGATATKIPTAESVKAYVDSSAGGSPTLQDVTTNGNTTDKQIIVDRDGVAFKADSQTENKIAVFKSTDNKGYITIGDNDTTAYIVVEGGAENGVIYFGNGAAADNLKIALNTGNITNVGTVDGVDIAALSTTVSDKQDTISLTTEGSSGAATFSDSVLNIPQYSGGTTIKSIAFGTTTETAISSGGTVGSKTSYTLVNLNTTLGGTEVSEGDPWSLDGGYIVISQNGTYMITFGLTTTVSATANRTLAGGMLFKQVGEEEYPLTGTQVYNYDRGTQTSEGASTWGSVYKGSGGGSYVLKVTEIAGEVESIKLNMGFWIEGRASSASGITVVKDGTILTIMKIA